MKIESKHKDLSNNNLSSVLYITSLIWVFPFSNIILPLILWLLVKQKDKVIDLHGRNLFNFFINWSIITFGAWIILLFLPWKNHFFFGFGVAYLMQMLLVVIGVIFILRAAYVAYKGKMFDLAFIYEFIK